MTQDATAGLSRKKRKERARKHGLTAKMETRAGRRTIARCRRKGRSEPSVSEGRRGGERRR